MKENLSVIRTSFPIKTPAVVMAQWENRGRCSLNSYKIFESTVWSISEALHESFRVRALQRDLCLEVSDVVVHP